VLLFDANDVAMVAGATTAGGVDDYQGACKGSSSNKHDGADVVYQSPSRRASTAPSPRR
jgi:hypothetical protein